MQDVGMLSRFSFLLEIAKSQKGDTNGVMEKILVRYTNDRSLCSFQDGCSYDL